MSKYCHLCASLDCSVSIAIVYINTKEGLVGGGGGGGGE